jgi:hypothetical protein
MRKAQYLAILAAFILSMESIGAQEFPSFGGAAYRDLLRAAFGQMERFARFLAPSKIRFLTDGGSDGGSSDGGSSSGDGGSSSDGGAAGAAGAAGAGAAGAGTGDSSGNTGDSSGSTGDGTGSTGDGTGSTGDGTGSASDGDGASASDSASESDAAAAAAAASAASATSDAAATSAATDAATDAATTTTTTNDDEAAPANDNNAPPSDPNTVTEAPTTNPTTIAVTSELAAIMAIPTTDPRDGSGPEVFTSLGVPNVADVTTIPPGGFAPPGPPVNVEIHAVIISAAQSPWDAIQKAPGIGNVAVVGGIVALGKTPIPGEYREAVRSLIGSEWPRISAS